MKDSDLGLVYIAEETNFGAHCANNVSQINDKGVVGVEFDTILHTFGDINRNQRSYLSDNVWENIVRSDRIQSEIADNSWFGEMDHPMQKFKNMELTPERLRSIDMTNRSHIIMNPRIVGDTLQAHIRTSCGTDAGVGMAKEIIGNKLKPAFSCRAIANLKLINNKPTVLIKSLITYDWVLYPSHARAHITSAPNVFRESANESPEEITSQDVMIPLREILEYAGYRDINMNTIMENFDLHMEDVIGFDKPRENFMVRDKNNVLYINMRPETKKVVDDFFASF